MRFWSKILGVAALAGVVISCGTYRNIYSDFDKSIDFSKYETFAWAPDSGTALPQKEFEQTPYDNDIVRNNAKNYITHSLSHRGYLVNIDSPDVIIQLVLLNEKKERIVTYNNRPYAPYYYYSPYYFPYYYPYYRFYTWYGWATYPPFWDTQVTTYTKTYVRGTITINVFDRRLKKLVWTGSAEGDIYDPAYVRFNVHPAIDRIMKKFPIKPLHKPRRHDNLQLKERVVGTWDRGLHPDQNDFRLRMAFEQQHEKH